MDILKETKVKTYYRVRSDVAGNVIIEKGSDGVNFPTRLQLLTKAQTIANLTNTEARELDNRTKLITNFIAAVERNEGNDPTMADPRWYNEAWDGLAIIKIDTIYDIGFKVPTIRTVALDPKLTPVKASQSDLFTKSYISQFRLNEKSAIRGAKGNGYVATFNGVDIMIPYMESMYVSRVFYIPNATVMDLY